MRDLALLVIVFAALPYILKRPLYGMLLWVTFSIMNPHRLAWGFAYDFPFAMIVAVTTLVSVLIHRKQNYPFPVNGVTVYLLLFIVWICISPVFSSYPESEMGAWMRVIKIQFMLLITFYVVGRRSDLDSLAWALALSVGFFGLKGGLFTLRGGGGERVFGPEGSFISDNNALALAIIMGVPLFRYLQLHSSNRWVRGGCIFMMLLCVASSVGSYSRGALLGLVGMATFLWFKSSDKGMLGVVGLVLGIIIFSTMPDSWTNRMNSITTYDEDQSSMGRINAWWMAWNMALNRFPIGGGFEIYNGENFALFAPNPQDIHAAHSIYFQVLGEHGFMGLFLFLAIYVAAWRCGSQVINQTKNRVELRWAHDMAAMLQVSLVGYAVGGAFLSLAYYDFPYYIAAMLVITRIVVDQEIKTVSKAASTTRGRTADTVAAAFGLKR